MALNDCHGERVALGYWLYDRTIRKSIEVVAFDCDYYYERLLGDDGRRPWEPYALNADGILYYIKADGGEPLGFPPFKSIGDAKAWADAQLWAPIDWKD